jgi:hypothetical protein
MVLHPKPIADGVWSLLGELGYKGGKMLDPCAGTGIFGATAPGNTAVESIELNETSGRINQLVNGGPAYHAIVSPFEAVASRTEDGTYDAVVTNVPLAPTPTEAATRTLTPSIAASPWSGISCAARWKSSSTAASRHSSCPRAWSARRAASPKSCAWP